MRSIEINGRIRHFEFGTYTFKIIRELIGIKHVEEVFEGISNKTAVRDDDGNVVLDDNKDPVMKDVRSQVEHIEFITMFLYACAMHGTKLNKEEVDFNDVEVSAWMDEIGVTKAYDLIGGLMESYNDKSTKEKKTIAQN